MFLSIMGMYEHDQDIFKGFKVPDGVDKDAAINNILLNCAELELIYPEPETLKLAITVWSVANQRTWEKLYETMSIEYNPIWNVDADITETNISNENRDINRTINLSDKRSVKGFNSNSWAEAEKEDHTGDEKVDDDVIHNNTRTERRTGNIGVTATQDLIKKEREIAEFNIIDFITDSFKQRFCLMVY